MSIKVRIQLLDLEGEANTPNVYVWKKTLHGEENIKQLNPGYYLDGKSMNPHATFVDIAVDEHTDFVVRAGTPSYGEKE